MRKSDVLLILALTSIVVGSVVHACSGDGGKLIERGRASTGMCYDVTVEDHAAYVVNNQGLVILNVSDPDRPKRIGSVKGLSPSFAVDLSGHFAYVGGEGGLAVIDVADPKHPRVIGRFLKGETINVLMIAGDIAFVITSRNVLKVLSIHNPQSPQEIGQFNDGGKYFYHALGLRDDVLYLADLKEGLELIDVSDARSPRKISKVPGTEGGNSVLIERDLLVLNFPEKAPAVYSISDPRSPLRLECRFNEDDILRAICLSSDYLVVKQANGRGQVRRITVFKTSDLLNPNPIASRNLARDIALHGTVLENSYIYFTGKGLSVFEIQE